MDKKFFFQIFGLLILIFGALILTYNQGFIPQLGNFGRTNTVPLSSTGQNVVQIMSSSNQVKAQVLVEVADTEQKRSLGLGGRTALSQDAGMLFIMPQRKKPTFWMKGMLIPLDFIWIDGNKIVDVLQNIQPPVAGQSDQTLQLYSPAKDVDKVLEVNAGYIAARGIQIGDSIQVGQLAPASP